MRVGIYTIHTDNITKVLLAACAVGLFGLTWRLTPKIEVKEKIVHEVPAPVGPPKTFDTGQVQVLRYDPDVNMGGHSANFSQIQVASPNHDIYYVSLCQRPPNVGPGDIVQIVAEEEPATNHPFGEDPNGCHNLVNFRVFRGSIFDILKK